MQHSLRRLTGLLVAVSAFAGACSSDEPTSATSTATSTSTSTTTTTTTTTTTVAAVGALTVTPLQYRDDVVADRMQLQLTNGLDEPLALASIKFVWAGFSSPLTERQLLVSPGQRVDLPVPLAPPVCTIDGLVVGPPPSLTDAEVVLTLQDGTDRSASVVDTKGILAGIHAAGCERQMILQQTPMSFADLRVETIDDRPITVGVLRLERGEAKGTVSVLSAGGTIPFSLVFPTAPADDALVRLEAGTAAVDLEVQFAEGRCDAHAVAETKQPFRFVFQIDLGDGITRPLVVQPDPAMHAQMLATVAAGCAALGLDGTLQPEG